MEISPRSKKTEVKVRMKHIILDEQSVGENIWNEMRITMIKHLFPQGIFTK